MKEDSTTKQLVEEIIADIRTDIHSAEMESRYEANAGVAARAQGKIDAYESAIRKIENAFGLD